MVCVQAAAQRFHVGVNFQYLIVKKVKVEADYIIPAESYNFYKVIDNRWKLFSGGQSILIGTTLQLDYKKFYIALEPAYELNSYTYVVSSPVAPGVDEKVTFGALMFQVNAPLFVGFHFKSSNLIRYSAFAGAGPAIPYLFDFDIREPDRSEDENWQYDRYHYRDMIDILYSDDKFWNAIAGMGVNFAGLVRVDIRYVRRLGSPGTLYKASIHNIGVGLTYYLPFHVLKKKVYYEE